MEADTTIPEWPVSHFDMYIMSTCPHIHLSHILIIADWKDMSRVIYSRGRDNPQPRCQGICGESGNILEIFLSDGNVSGHTFLSGSEKWSGFLAGVIGREDFANRFGGNGDETA